MTASLDRVYDRAYLEARAAIGIATAEDHAELARLSDAARNVATRANRQPDTGPARLDDMTPRGAIPVATVRTITSIGAAIVIAALAAIARVFQ